MSFPAFEKLQLSALLNDGRAQLFHFQTTEMHFENRIIRYLEGEKAFYPVVS
jgi:hypothetical protein